MKKRNLFEEIQEGFEALAEARAGKLTLRTHRVEMAAVSEVTPGEVLALREKLNLSRAVFARYLRTNPRTVENWEQGRVHPNAQASLLLQKSRRPSLGLESLFWWYSCEIEIEDDLSL